MKLNSITPLILFLTFCTLLSAKPFPTTSPEEVGLSSDQIEKLHQFIDDHVENETYASIATLVARDGKIADWRVAGYQDKENGVKTRKDTIYRIFSMTKTITSVAVMTLWEDGKIRLNDPISKYFPEMEDMKVLVGGTFEDPEFEEPKREIQIKDLLLHASGIRYPPGNSNKTLNQFYQQANARDSKTLDEFISRISTLPLSHHPGEKFKYGMSIDVLGALVQKVSGVSFGEYLQSEIFDPLGMKDTSFLVPEDKLDRVIKVYTTTDDVLQLRDNQLGSGGWVWPFEAGGAGLYSTMEDYLYFAQMLLNKGEFRGNRILGKKTVEFMIENHLAHWDDPTNEFSKTHGFGLGGFVKINHSQSHDLGSIGQFGWSGYASTRYMIDPEENMIIMIFLQHVPLDQHQLFPTISNFYYQSIVE